ncbi:hypothetical protein QE152_g35916 [Popillia japonica]|uniref:Uncharacterized protein n=1 Tax=Popillia japonica TaxID=7064 RepID=A0AAW1IEV4_POPJA
MEFHKPPQIKIKGNQNIEWERWKKSFNNYMEASDLAKANDKRKIAILLNLLSEDGQEVMDNFAFTSTDDAGKFDKVMEKFEEFCVPQKNLTVESFNFFAVHQRENEPFESFLMELQTKAASCELKMNHLNHF